MRIFIHSNHLQQNQLHLPHDSYHHLVRVNRLRVGDKISAVLQDKQVIVTCCVTDIKKESIDVTIESKHPLPLSDIPAITLIQCLPKGDKMTDIIRMVSEAGVRRLVPVISQRSVSRPKEKERIQKQKRWQDVALSAAMQAKLPMVPEITPIAPLDHLHSAIDLSAFSTRLTAWEESESAHHLARANLSDQGAIALVIGPEGGLDISEMAYLRSLQFQDVYFGNTILRVEHAGFWGVSGIINLLAARWAASKQSPTR